MNGNFNRPFIVYYFFFNVCVCVCKLHVILNCPIFSHNQLSWGELFQECQDWSPGLLDAFTEAQV